MTTENVSIGKTPAEASDKGVGCRDLLGPRPLTPEDVTAAADTAYDLGRRHKSEEVQAGAGNGVELIARERARQKAVEGWTPEHDAEHDGEQMAYAAACYALPDVSRQHEGRSVLVNTARGLAEPDCFRSAEASAPRLWPWEPQWWKPVPQDRVRELVKAGALIAAEIDRLQRSPDGPNASSEPCPPPANQSPKNHE